LKVKRFLDPLEHLVWTEHLGHLVFLVSRENRELVGILEEMVKQVNLDPEVILVSLEKKVH